MKKLLSTQVTIVVTTLYFAAFPSTALADNHLPFGYAQVYTMEVSDPAAILAAMQKMRNSPTGMKANNQVALSQFVANGSDDATHSIMVTYPDAAAMDESARLNANSKDWQEATAVFREAMEPESSALYALQKASITEGAVTSANPVSMAYFLNVTDPAAFMAAMDKLWDSDAAKAFAGNRYIGRAIANGDNGATHVVSFQANDMATLLNGFAAMQGSAEMAAYQKKAGSFRTIEGESITRVLWRSQP